MTSLSIGMLVDDGLLDWNTKIHQLLPEWQVLDPFCRQGANLQDILSHRTGIPRHDMSYGPNSTPETVVCTNGVGTARANNILVRFPLCNT